MASLWPARTLQTPSPFFPHQVALTDPEWQAPGRVTSADLSAVPQAASSSPGPPGQVKESQGGDVTCPRPGDK